MQAKELTDQELIQRIQQGQRDMLEKLMERYYDQIYYFCYYKVGDSETACDCTQETFLRLTHSIYTYREQKKFKGYLFCIARNVCNDYFRGKRPDYAGEEELENIPQQGNQMEAAETAQIVHKALLQLIQEQREAVILKYYYDFRLLDIARITGVPLPTAKSRLRRGLEKLKAILEKEGLGS